MRVVAVPTPDFASYIARADTVFVERQGEPLEELYAQGYLPYSGSKAVHNIFYSARSARVVLPELVVNSENRRIAKKFDGQFKKQRIAIADFVADEEFYSFMLAYFSERHGKDVMPRARLEVIMTSGLVSHTTIYRSANGVVGYVLEVADGTMRHYWYSAYDVSLTQQSLGIWLMLDCIRDAKTEGTAHYYLGTVYGPKALYKTNFEPLEWWDGNSWNTDIPSLKELGRSDA